MLEVEETLSVLTWNIDARPEERDARLKTLARIIQLHKPDILCLQEVWPDSLEYLEDNIDLDLALFYKSAKNSFGNAIFTGSSLKAIEAPTVMELFSVGENDKKSNLLSVLVESKSGRKWNIMTTHLAWGGMSEWARVRQVKEIESIASAKASEYAKEEIVQVVTGDFNTNPNNDSIRYLKGLSDSTPGAFWLDAWELSGDGSEGYTSTPDNPMAVSIAKKFNNVTRTDLLPKRRIDFILIRGWQYGMPGYPLSTKVLGANEVSIFSSETYPSDHYGVTTKLWDPPIR